MTETSPADRLGQVISGRYRVQELLGEGGMGAVYLAEHVLMRKRVALKLLHPELSDNEEILARFKREAEAAAHIEHPNVVSATDFGRTDDGGFFLVLEYVEGTSLRAAIARGAMAPARAVHIAKQIALALERAHGAGIVHRDLKPENVMLVKKGNDPDFVKVLDFGIARFDPTSARGPASSAQPLTRLGTILGTPEYMSPEQGVGDAVGPPSDLYAVGVMLYEMLTGKHPFDAEDKMSIMSMHMIAPVPPMSERAPGVHVEPALEAVVTKLLAKEAKDRHASARALVEALDAVDAADSSTPNSFVNDHPTAAAPIDAFAKTSYGEHAPPNVTTAPGLKADAKPSSRLAIPPLLLVVVPIVAVVLVVGLVLALRSPSSRTTSTSADGGESGLVDSTNEKAKAKTAGVEKIEAASKRGPEGLEALAKEYPTDPQVHRALALVLNESGRDADALRAIRAMLALGPDGVAAVDGELTGVVVGAAGLPASTDEAFALLEGPLGPRGVDALIDMAQMKSAPTLARRATRSLGKPDVRAKASPSAAVLLDMKAAKNCAAKHELLDRAKTDGDARVLTVLGSMKEQRGCGFMGMRDCWPCLRKDSALDDAMAAIQARSAK